MVGRAGSKGTLRQSRKKTNDQIEVETKFHKSKANGQLVPQGV